MIPAFPGRGWAIFFGVVTVIADIVVLAWPFDLDRDTDSRCRIVLVVIGVFEISRLSMMCRDVNTLKDTVRRYRLRSVAQRAS